MRGAVFRGVGAPMAIETLPDPAPEAGEVVVKVGRCGICSSDLHLTDGRSDVFAAAAGSVLGHEYSGEVVAIGRDVTRVKVGDHVACMLHSGCGRCELCLAGRQFFCRHRRMGGGGYAEYALHSENGMVQLTPALSMADGALVEPMSVALRGIKLAHIPPGARVAVIGAGPIGLAAAFWARRYGAGRIAVVTRSRRRHDLIMQMGADANVIAGDERGLAVATSEALGGAPDFAIDCVGEKGTLAQAIGLVGRGGTVVVLGFCLQPDVIMPAEAGSKEIRIQFSVVYDIEEYEDCIRAFESGAVEPRAMITGLVGMDAFPAQFEALRSTSDHCKVMLDPML